MKLLSADIAKLSALNPDIEDATLIPGLSCEDCPDECESTEYSAQVSYADFEGYQCMNWL